MTLEEEKDNLGTGFLELLCNYLREIGALDTEMQQKKI